MKYKLFVEKPYSRSGVYAWINVKDKKVYIGESIDMNSRFCDHLRCMYYKKNINALSNDSLIKAYKETDSPFFGVVLEYLFSQKTDKNFFLVNETIYMYEFSKIGFHLCNNISRDNTGYTRSFLKKQESYSDLLDWCSKKGIEKELSTKQMYKIIENVAKDKSVNAIWLSRWRASFKEGYCRYLSKNF